MTSRNADARRSQRIASLYALACLLIGLLLVLVAPAPWVMGVGGAFLLGALVMLGVSIWHGVRLMRGSQRP